MRSANTWKSKSILALKDLVVIGLMVATIEVAKMTLAFLPNIELTSFLLILYTLTFGLKTLPAIPVFILIEGSVYGFSLWWLMYLYAWPLLVGLTLLMKKNTSVWFWSILSGLFGLFFGALCSIPYFFIGAFGAGGSIRAGLIQQATWWVAGIPWDLVHCAGNFTLMLVLYHPIRRILKRCYAFLYPPEAKTKEDHS